MGIKHRYGIGLRKEVVLSPHETNCNAPNSLRRLIFWGLKYFYNLVCVFCLCIKIQKYKQLNFSS